MAGRIRMATIPTVMATAIAIHIPTTTVGRGSTSVPTGIGTGNAIRLVDYNSGRGNVLLGTLTIHEGPGCEDGKCLRIRESDHSCLRLVIQISGDQGIDEGVVRLALQ